MEVRSSFFDHDLFHLFIEYRIVLLSPPHELMDSIDELLLGLNSVFFEICCQVQAQICCQVQAWLLNRFILDLALIYLINNRRINPTRLLKIFIYFLLNFLKSPASNLFLELGPDVFLYEHKNRIEEIFFIIKGIFMGPIENLIQLWYFESLHLRIRGLWGLILNYCVVLHIKVSLQSSIFQVSIYRILSTAQRKKNINIFILLKEGFESNGS